MIVQESEYLDFNQVPQSQGMGKAAYLVLLIGLIGIFTMGGLSVYFAGYNHKWPSTHTMRMDLGSMPTIQ